MLEAIPPSILITTSDSRTTVFIDRRGQKFFGNENHTKASYTRVDPTTYQPIAKGRLRSYTPLLHAGGYVGRSFPHEQASNHDDTCLPIMEEPVALYPKPLDADRLLRVYQISTGGFPPPIGEPTPQHPPLPRRSGLHRTLPFHHAPQPISPPGVVDFLVHLSLRALVEELLVASARAEAPRDRKRSKYHGDGRQTPKDFRGANAETHKSLATRHAH